MVFGFITISNVIAGPDRTDLVVEARRASSGAVLASYRMGSVAQHGETFFLEIPVESSPLSSLRSTTNGTDLVVVLKDDAGDLAQIAHKVGERGKFRRADFTIGPVTDTNGLPDAWEILYFGIAGQDPNADPDGDGRTNLQEYLLGTNPKVADAFQLTVAQNGATVEVSFYGAKAQGPGYQNLSRRYSLQYATNVTSGVWIDVPGFVNVTGNNAPVKYTTQQTTPPKFFRGQVSLGQ